MNTLDKIFPDRKRILLFVLIFAILLLAGWLLFILLRPDSYLEGVDTVPVERGALNALVEATGTVRSVQHVRLSWQITGEIETVNVEVGQRVSAGEVLASLEETSLPAPIILARNELINARQALDDLLESQMQRAEALKAVQDAEYALEDARNPAVIQAQAQADVATAALELENAQLQLDLLVTPPSAESIENTYANLLLARQAVEDLEEDIAETEQNIRRPEDAYMPWESRGQYKKLLDNLHLQLAQARLALQKKEERYDDLLSPPDPDEVAGAEAAVARAKAQLEDAQREWERVKDGFSQAEIAVLEAELADAQREWERVKDGPTADDIAAAQARIAAAQAVLDQVQITAPFDGVITEVVSKPGDQVSPGMLAFRLDDLSQMLIDLEISEMDIPRVGVGQDVTLVLESVLAKDYRGTVVEISPVGTEAEGLVYFEAIVAVTNPDEQIKPGMTAEADIVVDREENALLVPNQAIRSLGGQRVVFLVDPTEASSEGGLNLPFGEQDSRIRPVTIEIGLKSISSSQIVGGELRQGDRILANPPDEIVVRFQQENDTSRNQ
jgi:HlyD family secretion protein